MGACKSCVVAKHQPRGNHQPVCQVEAASPHQQSPVCPPQQEWPPQATLGIPLPRGNLDRQRSSRINAHSFQDLGPQAKELVSGTLLDQPKTSRDLTFIIKSLKKHVLFKKLRKETIEQLAQKMGLYEYSANSTVYEENEPGVAMFVLYNGLAEYRIGDRKVATYSPGKVFGENALVQDVVREGTVHCTKECLLWRIQRIDYLQIVESLNIQNYAEYKQFINSVPHFQLLTSDQQENLLELLIPKEVLPGEVIIEAGSVSDLFYLIKDGEVKCLKQNQELRRLKKGEYFGEQGLLYGVPRTATIVAVTYVKLLGLSREALSRALGDQLINVIYKNTMKIALERHPVLRMLSAGQVNLLVAHMRVNSFTDASEVISEGTDGSKRLWIVLQGCLHSPKKTLNLYECAGDLLSDCPVLLETYRAEGTTNIASISKKKIEALLGDSLEKIIESNQRTELISSVKLLHSLPPEKLRVIAAQMTLRDYHAKQTLFREGEPGAEFFIIHSGEVEVRKDGKVLRTLDQFSYFGERAILQHELRTATVIATQPTTCWVLTQDAFMDMLDKRMKSMLTKRLLHQDDAIELKDLCMVKKLGSGVYGNVFLTVNAKNDSAYALKTVSRAKLARLNMHENLVLERHVLLKIDHPMIMKLVKTFKDEERLYLLMEYVQGLQFFDVLEHLRVLPETTARFYAACLVLIMEHLHERLIAYRDFKPETIMIDSEGYPKLIDFGASKIINGRAFTMVGTPHYMAPEVINGMGYSFSADCWSLGVMLFEFVTGRLPFGQEFQDPYRVYQAVLGGSFDLPFSACSGPSRALIAQLLDTSPAVRGSARSLRTHPFFSSTQWDRLATKTLVAPYVPKIKFVQREIARATHFPRGIFKVIRREEINDSLDGNNIGATPANWDHEF